MDVDRQCMVVFVFFICCCRELRSKPHVMWVDNFSKLYRVMHNTEDVGAYHDCLWTGEAIHMYTGGLQIDMSQRFHDDGSIISIMPDNMFDKSPNLLYACTKVDALGSTLWSTSTVKVYGVNNIPLKPVLPRARNPALYDHLQKREDGVGEFIPTQLYKMNPGSDTGLHAYMRMINNKYTEGTRRDYTIYKADCNIFSRWCKVTLSSCMIDRF
jgi:hypothetical protein